jgi:hypothetical protein
MKSFAKFVLALVALASLNLPPAPASAQYMYLDTNGNGVPDADDGFLNYPTSTAVAVWLKTDVGRDGLPDACSNPAGTALTISSYQFALRVVSGYVTWGALTNHMSSFTTPLGTHTTTKDYHSGYAGTSSQPAGIYKLATLSVQSTNNLVPGKLAIQIGFDVGGTSYATSFGSDCLGRDSDSILKLGSDWFDANPFYTPTQWIADGVNISNFINDEGRVAIAPDGFGGAFIAFESVVNPSDSDIYVQRVDSRGNVLWSEGGNPACLEGHVQAYVTIVADGSGGCILAWQDDRGVARSDIFAQHLLPDGSIAPGWNQNGNAICTAASTQILPQACSDGSGGAFITWKDARNGTWDVYLQRVTAGGTQPAGWPATLGIPVTTAVNHQIDPRLVPDGAGGVIITWQDDAGLDIYAQRIDANGGIAPGWAPNGTPVCLQTGFQQHPELCSDMAGGAIIAWDDTRSGNADIYAQRVLANGSVAWTLDGVPLCRAAGIQERVTVAAAGGGAIVAWEDSRLASIDIYAQAISASGALDPRWPADGDTVCIAAGNQTEPRIVSDGANGAVVSWEDDGAGIDNYNIFVQRVIPEGRALYGQSGRSVCSAILNQRHPRIAPDGVGGAIIAWEDFRNGGDFDPYAMRVAPQGGGYVTAVETVSRGAEAQLFPNVPNPFNPETELRFSLGQSEHVLLTIFDVRGAVVTTVADRHFDPGRHELRWSGRNAKGVPVSSGVYFAVLRTKGITRVQKLVLAR